MIATRAITAAFVFLTRLPVRAVDSTDRDIGRSIACFPFVGLTLGLLLTAAAWLLGTHVPSALVALLLVALLAGLTGGLHLDGLADVFDGLGDSHGNREHMLTIMRDSRIGAHGAVAVTLVLLAKTLALSTAVQHHDLRLIAVFPAIARWAVTPLIVFFPYARDHGLGKVFHANSSPREVGIATLFIATLGIGLGVSIPSIVLTLVIAVAFGVWMQRRLGGLTGDVYGAAIELTEVVFLIAASAGT